MAVLTVYLLNTAATSPDWFGRVQDNGVAPAGALSAFGWTVAKTALTTAYWRGRIGATARSSVAQAASYVDSAASPTAGTGAAATTAGDSFRSDNPLIGKFAAGNWNFTFGMRTGAASNSGRIRCNLWAGPNINGTGARKLNSATIVGTAVTMSTTTTTYNSTATWAAPEVILNNEYVFLQVEWQSTVVGTSNSCTAQFYQASFVATDFVQPVAFIASNLAVTGAISIGAGSVTIIPWNQSNVYLSGDGTGVATLTEDGASSTHAATRHVTNFIAGARYTVSIQYKPIGPHPRALELVIGSDNSGVIIVGGIAGTKKNAFPYGPVPWTLESSTVQAAGGGFYTATMTLVCTETTLGWEALYLYEDATNAQTYAGFNDGSGIQFQQYLLQLNTFIFQAPLTAAAGAPVFDAPALALLSHTFDAEDLTASPPEISAPAFAFYKTFLDPSYTSSIITLSNGNLTATKNATAPYSNTHSQVSRNSNFLYAEVQSVVETFEAEASTGIGVSGDPIPLDGSLNWFGVGSTNSIGYFSNGGIYLNGPIVQTIEPINIGDWIGIDVDLSVGRVWFRNITKGGVWSAGHTVTGLGADCHLGVSLWDLTDSCKFNFDGPFRGDPGVGGFTRWDGSAPNFLYDITAVDVSAGVPSLDVPALTERISYSFTATALAVPAPSIGSSQIKQRHVFVANNLTSTPYVIATSTIGQRHALGASALAVQPPTYGSPVVAVIVNVTASNLTATAPVLGAPTLKPTSLLAASNLATAPPTEAAAAFNQAQALGANALASSPPALATPAFNRTLAVVASPLAIDSLSIGAGAFAQPHTLTANVLATSPPVLGAATISQAGVMAALPLVTVPPTLGASTLTQKHVLTASTTTTSPPVVASATLIQQQWFSATSVTTTSPSVGAGVLGQRHVLAAIPLTVVVPTVPAAVLGQSGVMACIPIAVASPAIGVPAIGQKHVAAAQGLTAGPPALGSTPLGKVLSATALAVGSAVISPPLLTKVLTATPLSAGAPALGAPACALRVFDLTTSGLAIGPPTIPALSIGQSGAMAVVSPAVGSPVLGAPALVQRHVLSAAGATVGAPVLAAPAFGQRMVLSALPLAVGASALGAGVLHQEHRLSASTASAGGPTLGTGNLGQAGVMAAIPLWIGSPSLPAIDLSERQGFTGNSFTVGAPSLAAAKLDVVIKLPRPQNTFAGRFKPDPAVLQQVHPLTAQAASAGRPVVPVATFYEGEHFPAVSLAVSSPVLGAPALAPIAHFTAIGLAPRPELGRPVIGQLHRVAPRNLSVSYPWIGYPRLGEPPIALDAIDLSAGVPAFGVLRFVPLDHLLSVVNITSRQRLAPITGARGATTLTGQRGDNTITAGRSNGTIIGARQRNSI